MTLYQLSRKVRTSQHCHLTYTSFSRKQGFVLQLNQPKEKFPTKGGIWGRKFQWFSSHRQLDWSTNLGKTMGLHYCSLNTSSVWAVGRQKSPCLISFKDTQQLNRREISQAVNRCSRLQQLCQQQQWKHQGNHRLLHGSTNTSRARAKAPFLPIMSAEVLSEATRWLMVMQHWNPI